MGLQLDRSNPDVAVLMSKDTVIPDPEAGFASKKLFQFVESRKEITAQSYRFFVEHAHSQFFQHEAFNQSARARTRTKDLDAGDFHPSTKLKGYVWIGTKDNFVHVPKSQAGAVEMVEGDADEEEEEEKEEEEEYTLPTLEVKIRPQPQEEEKEEYVGSQKGEETSHHSGHSETAEMPAVEPLPRGRKAEGRFGNFIIQQLKPEHQELVRLYAFNSPNILGADDRDPARDLQSPDQVGSFGMVFMMEHMAHESHGSFMNFFQIRHKLTLQMSSIMNYVSISRRSPGRTNRLS